MKGLVNLVKMHTLYLLAMGYVVTYMAAWACHAAITVKYFMDGPEDKLIAFFYLVATIFSPVGVVWSFIRWFFGA